MSQRKNKQRRQQERVESRSAQSLDPANIYDDLLDLLRHLPLPAAVPPGERTREYQKNALAPAIAWGWLVRIARSGAAAVNLEKNGFGGETAPLTRTCLEHAIRLLWAKEHGSDFIEVALLAQEDGLQKVIRGQQVGWAFDPALADAMERHMQEASDDYRSDSNLTRLRAIVDLDPARRGPLYMGWLLDTQESHPSLASAQPYYERSEADDCISLRPTSKFPSAAALKACIALIAGFHAYGAMTNISDYVEPQLERIVKRLQAGVGEEGLPPEL